MANIKANTFISGDADTTFEVVTGMDSFTQFISGVKEVRVLQEAPNKRLTEWQVEIQGTVVKWREEQIINQYGRTIYFRMIDGDFADYEGQWIVTPSESGSKIELRFSIQWDTEFVDERMNRALELKARLAARWALRELRKKIGQGKTFSAFVSGSHNKLISLPLEIISASHKKIIAYHDKRESLQPDKPFIIVMPGYGETKRDCLPIGYYLANNDFNVIRYDATDHIGESDGQIKNATMQKFKEDLITVAHYARTQLKATSIGVVASSLACRAALKAMVHCPDMCLLIGLVGVVNLQRTLLNIYQEDIIRDIKSGHVKPEYEVLGYVIDKQFPIEAIATNYHDLNSTFEDVRRIKSPIILFHAERDTWVDLDEAKQIIQESRNWHSDISVVPNSMHLIMENPIALRSVLRQMVLVCHKHLLNRDVTIDDVAEPSKRDLALQNRIEKERLKLQSDCSEASEREFWDKYLNKFTILSKVPDYSTYLSTLVDLLHINGGCEKILDAGCGNGFLGAQLLSDSLEKLSLRQQPETRRTPKYLFQYYGTDRSEKILDGAKKGHRALLHDCIKKGKVNGLLPHYTYVQTDLETNLPFEDNFFEKICSSLVLSYLNNPLHAIHELVRVLKRGGRIVLTSMKPSADISQIYRNFVILDRSEVEKNAARELLNEAGQIKQKEGEGLYHFFSEKELKTLLLGAGVRNISSYRSFGNQANIIIGTKK